MEILHIKNLTKTFDNGKVGALKSVSFSLEKGEITSIIGESGCGKTTLIRLITGLEIPDDGDILLQETIVSSKAKFVSPEKRNVGMVFQDYALFPHLTVLENILYGISNYPNKKKRAVEMIDLIGLRGFEKRYPHELSGGQQQRVALARALAPNPQLLILDEPFSNLDVMLRTQLRDEIFDIIKKTEITAIFVTHDTKDALAISDKIMVLENGNLIQQGTAKELYEKPISVYVASLFGRIIKLPIDLLQKFGFQSEISNTYFIREQDLKLSKNIEFSTLVNIESSVFLGNMYQLKINKNKHKFIFQSDKKPAKTEVLIGFNKGDLLVF